MPPNRAGVSRRPGWGSVAARRRGVGFPTELLAKAARGTPSSRRVCHPPSCERQLGLMFTAPFVELAPDQPERFGVDRSVWRGHVLDQHTLMNETGARNQLGVRLQDRIHRQLRVQTVQWVAPERVADV